MKNLQEIDLKNKKVVVRCDFNVPFEDGKIADDSKIKASIKTINYLLSQNCLVILLSHLNRVKSEEDKAKNSLEEVAKRLADLLNKKVKFIGNCYGEKVKEEVLNSSLGEVVLLENTRWMDYPEKLESKNNEELAKFWASLGDFYINDAFGSCHRAHASTAGICKYLPHAYGFLVLEELKALDVLIHDTPKPFTVIMGGAKVSDKLPIIKSLLPKCDHLLLGGGIANSFLKAKGEDVGSSLVADDEDILKELKDLLDKYAEKIVLPVDFKIDDGAIYDIGEESIKKFTTYINESAIIFMNGTVGKFEDERFSEGTINLFKALVLSQKRVIIGGGDTASAVKKCGFMDKFEHISTGGGATLEYIANGTLEALEWMNK